MSAPGARHGRTRLRHAVARTSPDGTIQGSSLGDAAAGKPPLSPRCGKPLTIYEVSGTVIPDKYDGFGRVIREARERRGMSRTQLAEAVGGRGRKLIADWENERFYPRKGLAVLEEVLGVSLGGPACARPAGHNGRCRSAAAVERAARSAGWPLDRKAAAA